MNLEKEMVNDTVVCQQCGTKNPVTNNFCTNCANPLKQNQYAPQNISQAAPQNFAQNAPQNFGQAAPQNFAQNAPQNFSQATPQYQQQAYQQYGSAPQPTIVINNVNNNTNTNNLGGAAFSPKSRLAALILCFFLGYLGIHRFYAGKIGTGILWFFTAGLFGIGALVDFIMILCGSFTDKEGLYVKKW